MCGRLVVLAGLIMAGATWGCSGPERPPTAATAADTADWIVFGLNHQATSEGVLRTRVQADTAYFYQMSQKARMRHIKVTFYSPEGRETSTVTADSGLYDWRTQNMEGWGHVVAMTPDQRRLTTTVLSYHKDRQEIVGSQPFVFDSPERHLQGDGFTSDPDFKNVVTQHPTHGTVGKVELNP